MSMYRMGDIPTDIKAEYRPFCKECDWIGKRTSDLNFAQDQATEHDKEHSQKGDN